MTSFEKSVSLERLNVLYDYIERVRDDIKKVVGLESNNQLEIYQDLHKAMIYVEDASNRLLVESTAEVYKAGTEVPRRDLFVCTVCGRSCKREDMRVEQLLDGVWTGRCYECIRKTAPNLSEVRVLSEEEKKRIRELVKFHFPKVNFKR